MANHHWVSAATSSPRLVTRRLPAFVHALAAPFFPSRNPNNRVTAVLPLIARPQSQKASVPYLYAEEGKSYVYANADFHAGVGRREPGNSVTIKEISSTPFGPSSRQVCFEQRRIRCCDWGEECGGGSDRAAHVCASLPAVIVPAGRRPSGCRTSASSPRSSSPLFSIGAGSVAVVAGVLADNRQLEYRFRSTLSGGAAAAAVGGGHRGNAAALPIPPPIFGCTGNGSSYEAVSQAVEDAEAVTALHTGSCVVLRVTSMDFYETCVYERSHTQPLVCCFVTRGSLQARLLLQPFREMAAATAAASGGEGGKGAAHPLYLLIDCDEVPRAAYHARVEHVPSVVVMKKDDGFREIISDPSAAKTAAELIQETKQALDRLQQQEQQLPAGVQPGPSRYTKNIGIDNLNVYRVGWLAP